MKRNILYAFLVAILIIGLQNSYGQVNKANRVEKVPQLVLDPYGGSSELIIGQKISETDMGGTKYDLQTYNAIGKRTFAYSDGTIGAAWMMAFDDNGWPDRAIGYNFFDGSAWGEEPTESIATIRTGWACYTPLGENGEIAVGHADDNGKWVLWFCKRDTKGTGDWEEFTLEGPEDGVGIVWPAIVTGGTDHNTLHVLGRTYGDEYMGQSAALLYSRSNDGGETWDIQNYFFDDLGPDYFEAIDAEAYAWAEPNGNTIAFSVGFDIGHGCIMKSNDEGDTWEFIEVFNCPIYPAPGGPSETFGAGDGTQAVAIDNEGMVHLVFGRMRHVYGEDGGALYYPYTDGVIYWNENMPPLDTTIISSYTLEYLEENGNLVGQVVGDGIDGLMDEYAAYFSSMTSNPQILIDGMNRIFVLWSGVAPEFTNGIVNFRHIYGNSSSDGGLTWNGIQDLTDQILFIFSECVYPNLAPEIVDGKIHFTFQADGEPGIVIWAGSQAELTDNDIMYMDLETDALTGIGDRHSTNIGLEVSQNYPNPFHDVTYIEVSLSVPAALDFTVTDVAGRTVHREHFEEPGSDRLRIRFESQQLKSGVYYYKISSETGSYSGKMIIQ